MALPRGDDDSRDDRQHRDAHLLLDVDTPSDALIRAIEKQCGNASE
jgi:hypothetical protein